MRIDIIVFDGVDELDAIGPLRVFRHAHASGADLEAKLVHLHGKEEVTGAHGLRFATDAAYAPGADVLVVPGGGWLARTGRGAWAEVQEGGWLPRLQDAARDGVLMTSVCTGAMLLGHAGVIGERPATTHWSALPELEALGATVSTDRVVDAGSLVTSGGVTSGLDLALWLVERLSSTAIADRVAREIEYRRFRPAVTT